MAVPAATALGKLCPSSMRSKEATLGCTKNCCGRIGRPSCQIRHFVDLPPPFVDLRHQHLKIKR